ncbi:MAG: carboxypeptidase-like regulatory domain-containing protein, partial [Bacteroides sp.]|nr:carboxypeptidase-like regulatory domain-containing protein [Bacteroides sp.]
MELKNERLPQVLKRLEKITGYKIMFTYDDIIHWGLNGRIDSRDIKEVMDVVVANKPLDYRIDGQYIYVTLRESERKQLNERRKLIEVSGSVLDKDRVPLAGVNVLVVGTNKGIVTDADGNYKLTLPMDTPSELRFTFIGMKPVSKRIEGNKDIAKLVVVMEEDQAALEEVVV